MRRRPLPSQRCLASPGANGLRRCSSSFYSGEKKPVFSDRFLKYGRRERITRPSGRCLRNVVSLRSAQTSFGGSHPHFTQAKKNLSFQTGFLNMVGERGLRAPAGRALRAVAFATLSRFARRKPPSEVLILILFRRKKTCLFRQVS